jgi:phenylalanyl-tRNA synthetase alpha chain
MTSNIPQNILDKLDFDLHNRNFHPICLIKERIYKYFNQLNINFSKFDDLSHFSSVKDNFDLLLIPKDHPSRSISDTYYVNEQTVLRTHTSCHQNQLLSQGEERFLVTGDVYRKDEIDRFHFPIFHQMEGVCIVENDVDPSENLKKVLTGLVEYLFPKKQYRFNDDYFPFTNPSYEIEVLLNDKWVEVLGCGVIQSQILDYNKVDRKGWAFGLGLERLAMIFYGIPDIRLFWSNDIKFLDQFKNRTCDDNIVFVEYPKIDSIYKDISFWIRDNEITMSKHSKKWTWKLQNDFYDMVRNCFDDNIESLNMFDSFHHPKKNRYSQTWRLTLNPSNEMNNPAEFNSMCNKQLEKLRQNLVERMGLELR